jgi:hypothetical protein
MLPPSACGLRGGVIINERDRIGKTIHANLVRFLVSGARAKDRELDLVVLVEEPGAG